ncbi:hypothetical protein [Streptomyces curacoi]|nr:hypothetical protein [Streptomyces curacoi]
MSRTGLAHGRRTALPQAHERRARPDSCPTDARPVAGAGERYGEHLAEE